jgi:glycosyltransferase involved in cell wall biosynthesis
MKYSVVIPCYNEEENLPCLVKSIQELAFGKDIEFLLVENGSKDKSFEMMKSFTADLPYVRIVKVDVNCGLGYGIFQGIKQARGDYIGWVHADMQTPVSDIEKMFLCLKENDSPFLMVKATRHNRSFVDYFFTNCMAVYCSILFKILLYDIQAVPVMVSRSLFEHMDEVPNGFAFDMYVYYEAKRRGYKVKRIPVRIFKREKGASSWNSGFISRIRLSRYMIKAARQISKGIIKV